MRARSIRRRHASGIDAALPAPPDTAVAVTWGELSEVERTALKRMNRGPYADLADAIGSRLIDLGLAVPRPGGIGISRAGRELVITTLLEARQQEDG